VVLQKIKESETLRQKKEEEKTLDGELKHLMDEVRIMREKEETEGKLSKEEKVKLESLTTKEKETRERLTALRTELEKEATLIASLQRETGVEETHVANEKKEVTIDSDKLEGLKHTEKLLMQKINQMMESEGNQQKYVDELKSKQSNIKNHVDRLVTELAKINQQIGIDTASETTALSELSAEKEKKLKLDRHYKEIKEMLNNLSQQESLIMPSLTI